MLTAADLFAADPRAQKLFYAVWDRLRGMHEDVDIDVCDDAVRVRESGVVYCWIWAPYPGSGDYPDGSVVVSVGLAEKREVPASVRVRQVAYDRWFYHIVVARPEDVSGDALALVEAARCESLCDHEVRAARGRSS